MSNDEPNKYLFQGQELQNDLGLNWYQYKYRMHDPALGRFTTIDPLANDYVYNSPYAFSENKVTGHIELEGLEALSIHALGGGRLTTIATQDVTSRVQVTHRVARRTQYVPQDPGSISIPRTSIYHPNAFLPHERAGHLGVDIGETATGIYALKNLPKLLKSADGLINFFRNLDKISGSSPLPGVIEVSDRVKSVSAFKNFNPKADPEIGVKAIEFVFDTERQIFAVGMPKANLGGSPHQQLQKVIGANSDNVVGGIFKRGDDGTIILNEHSGHFGMNFNDANRQQLIEFLKERTGQNVILHTGAPN